MKDDPVADGDVRAYDEPGALRIAFGFVTDMQHRQILDIRARAYPDGIYVPTYDCAWPYRGIVSQNDIANHAGSRVDVDIPAEPGSGLQVRGDVGWRGHEA